MQYHEVIRIGHHKQVRRAVSARTPRARVVVIEGIALTPRARRVVCEMAAREARVLDQHIIRPGHILLGLVYEGEIGAGGLLENLGVDLRQARQYARCSSHLCPPPLDAGGAS